MVSFARRVSLLSFLWLKFTACLGRRKGALITEETGSSLKNWPTILSSVVPCPIYREIWMISGKESD